MGERDKFFLCPDCFCETMQTVSLFNSEVVFFCRRCGLGPLVFCGSCLSLITVDAAETATCPYCLMAERIIEERGINFPDRE